MNRHKRWPLRPLSRALARSHSHSASPSTATQATETDTTAAAFQLKHVTRSNFEATLSDLRSHVRAADFVAIDLEMTGLTSAPWRDSLEFDRFDVRYLKVKDSAEKFAVVQLGVCPFRWVSHTQSFVAHPHNFFVFPRQEHTFDAPPHEFLCQTTSMDFLAKYQFDFNACVREGISYLSRRQEEDAIKRLEMLYEDEVVDSARDMKLVAIADILFAERMKNTLFGWRSELLHGGNKMFQPPKSLNNSTQRVETMFYHMRPALSLKGFTSHQLRVIKLVAKKHFADLVYIHIKDENFCPQNFVVYTDSESDRESLMREAKDDGKKVAEEKIKSAIGLRHVFDLLSSEQKLIVGHNCFLDIAHIHSKFVGPLPSTTEKFVSSISECLPHIIDTKLLLNVNPIMRNRMKKSKTSLSSAFSLLCPQTALSSRFFGCDLHQSVKIDVEVDNVRYANWDSGAKHEAGYDAFMTGCVFAQTCSHIGVDFSEHQPLAQSQTLQKYINRLYLSWTRGDIIDLRSSQTTEEHELTDSVPKRISKIDFQNIVMIWGFPSKLKAREIKECICKIYGPLSVTSIYHVDNTAVFVMFKNPEFVSLFLELKQHLDTTEGPITVFHPLSMLLEGGNTRFADYETYKEICTSPISKISFAEQAEAVTIKSRRPALQPQEEAHEASDMMLPGLVNAG